MKRSKRIGCLLLVLLMSAQTLTSCDGSETTETTGETTSAVMETAAAETELSANLPDVKYDGETITMLAAAEQWQDYYFVEEDTGDVVDSAVYQRNLVVEEQFDVKLDFNIVNGYSAGMSAVATALEGAVMGGTGEFDIYAASAAYVSGVLTKNYLCDLNQVEYMDFTKPWWLGDINKQITINDHLYLTAGTLGMQCLENVRCMFFNKKLATDLALPSMYDHVYDGTWTYDTMVAYTEMAYVDLDGNGEYSAGDTYGLAGTSTEAIYALSFGFGQTNTTIGEDGLPHAVGVTERMEDIFQTLKVFQKDKKLYYGTNSGVPADELYPMFVENRVLFMAYTLTSATSGELRDTEDFGILPMPKFDENQEKYASMGFADVFGIPRGQSDADIEQSGILLEAMNFENYQIVYPAYKDVAMERKYSRDEESPAMIDIILDGVYVDFGLIFYSLSHNSYFLTIVGILDSFESFSTFWAAQGNAIEERIAAVVEDMATFES